MEKNISPPHGKIHIIAPMEKYIIAPLGLQILLPRWGY